MIRVYKSSSISPLWLILGIPLLVVIGLPIALVSIVLLVILNVVFAFLKGSRPGTAQSRPDWEDPNLSPVIDNKEIGPYRVKRSNEDPSVIEVLD